MGISSKFCEFYAVSYTIIIFYTTYFPIQLLQRYNEYKHLMGEIMFLFLHPSYIVVIKDIIMPYPIRCCSCLLCYCVVFKIRSIDIRPRLRQFSREGRYVQFQCVSVVNFNPEFSANAASNRYNYEQSTTATYNLGCCFLETFPIFRHRV